MIQPNKRKWQPKLATGYPDVSEGSFIDVTAYVTIDERTFLDLARQWSRSAQGMHMCELPQQSETLSNEALSEMRRNKIA
jgi:hypothetical protein